jgi:hypothetical protein
MKTPKEKFSFHFGGLKFEAANPGTKTIIILVILLAFVIAMVVLLKMYCVPLMTAMGSNRIITAISSKMKTITNLFKGRSP